MIWSGPEQIVYNGQDERVKISSSDSAPPSRQTSISPFAPWGHPANAACLDLGIERGKIVRLERNRAGRPAQNLGQLNNFGRPLVAPAGGVHLLGHLPTPRFGFILVDVRINDPARAEFVKAVARFGNPYRFLELEEHDLSPQPTAHGEFEFKGAQANLASSEPGPTEGTIPANRLRTALDEVLNGYKPYVARSEWKKVMGFRPEFLAEAQRDPARVPIILDRLEQLRFRLMPGEKVEYNRAPAERIINELKQLLR